MGYLEGLKDVNIYHHIMGSEVSSFKSGGEIENLIYVNSVDALINVVRILKEKDERYYIMGYGSNTLISDRGVKNVINLKHLNAIDVCDNIVSVNAGCGLISLSHKMRDIGLSGLEKLSGIPGSVGGAICMNAGAYDAEISDNVQRIDVLNGDCVETLLKDDIKFRYRGSSVLDKKLIVIRAVLKLQRKDKSDIDREMQRVKNKRMSSQPQEPSLGCTFLMDSGISAGAYIDALGLKGFRIGGAEVSTKHAGFIVNKGSATSDEYLSLTEIIERKIYCAYGVQLKREFIYIGD